jgi:hypothetical protein
MSTMRAVMSFFVVAFALLLGAHALAAGASPAEPNQPGAQEETVSPEERMRRRFPQPVRVGDLIGLPILDWSDSTIGRIKLVVRTNEGKILLIVPYGGLFGLGQRLVPVPIEVVAMLGRQVAALDMPIEEFEKAPTWYGSNAAPLGNDEIIRVAITRR